MKLTVGKLRHERMIKLILWMLRHDNDITSAQLLEFYPPWELNKRILPTGILKRVKKGHYSLNIEVLQKCVYIVTPDLYKQLGEPKSDEKQKAKSARTNYRKKQRLRNTPKPDKTVDPDPLSVANILIPELEIKPGWKGKGTHG